MHKGRGGVGKWWSMTALCGFGAPGNYSKNGQNNIDASLAAMQQVVKSNNGSGTAHVNGVVESAREGLIYVVCHQHADHLALHGNP